MIGSDTCYFSFTKVSNNNSHIKLYNVDCKLLDNEFIEINGKVYEIKKYKYDIPEECDDETIYYMNDVFGLLYFYNQSFSQQYYNFEKNKISKQLIEHIHNNRIKTL